MNVPVLKQMIVTLTPSAATLKDCTPVAVTKDIPETVELAQVPCVTCVEFHKNFAFSER